MEEKLELMVVDRATLEGILAQFAGLMLELRRVFVGKREELPALFLRQQEELCELIVLLHWPYEGGMTLSVPPQLLELRFESMTWHFDSLRRFRLIMENPSKLFSGQDDG